MEMHQELSTKKAASFRYKPSERKKIQKRIKQLKKIENLGYLEMVGPLNKEGFKSPDGSPIRYCTILKQGRMAGLKLRSARPKRKVKSQPVIQTIDPLLVRNITTLDEVMASNLSAEAKIVLYNTLRSQE